MLSSRRILSKDRMYLSMHLLAFVVAFWIGKSSSMDEIPEIPPRLEEAQTISKKPYEPLPDRNEETLPKGYVHNAVGYQVSDYRKLYTAALAEYGGDYDVMCKSPIKGLGKIAKNAFALAHDVILKAKNGQINEIKKMYLELLEILWAEFLGYRDSLTSEQFQAVNMKLASVIENFNKINRQPNLPLRKTYKTPIFIIYAKPEPGDNRGIASDRFVDEYFHKDFRAYLVLFDVLSEMPTQNTSKNVHYSLFAGTYRMLFHDFQHVALSLEALRYDTDSIGYALTNKIYDMARIMKEKGDLQGYRILMNGLFLLTHEKPRSINWNSALPDPKNNLDEIYPEFLKKYCVHLSFMKGIDSNKSLTNYKHYNADWEYFLKAKDANGEPFFDRKKIKKEERYKKATYYKGEQISEEQLSLKYITQLEDAYKRFWKKFQDLALSEYQSVQ